VRKTGLPVPQKRGQIGLVLAVAKAERALFCGNVGERRAVGVGEIGAQRTGAPIDADEHGGVVGHGCLPASPMDRWIWIRMTRFD
jgi:hypothetical protein